MRNSIPFLSTNLQRGNREITVINAATECIASDHLCQISEQQILVRLTFRAGTINVLCFTSIITNSHKKHIGTVATKMYDSEMLYDYN